MTESTGEESLDPTVDDIENSPSRARRLIRRRETKIATVVFVLVVLGFVGWFGAEAFSAKSGLEQARADAQEAKQALTEGRADDALRFAASSKEHARLADNATHSLPWSVVSQVPWLGSPFETGRQISRVVLGLASDVLQPSAQVGITISPDRLFQGSRLNLHLLRDTEPALTKMSADARRLLAEADAISVPAYLSVVGKARSELQAQTANVAGLLDDTSLVSRLAPAMMGADGPRTYFMGFQTNAEARGTGGILGGFGILRFDGGEPKVETLGPNTELRGPYQPIDLGPEFADQYGFTNPSSNYLNSNVSSHFPYAAQIWKSIWAQESGTNADGVIALDPVALSYVLGAAGPVTMPSGETITKDNVVELTESTAYARFPTDQMARKRYLQDIAAEIVKKMTGAVQAPRELLKALGRAVGERRISVWSASPDEQKLLEKTPLAHEIPDTPAPYAEVVVNNLGGNKLDYYLRRSIEYVADGCTGNERNSTVTIRLTSAVPDTPLPDYVAATPGLSRDVPISLPHGSMLTSVRLIATKGAKLLGAFSNGQRVPVFTGTERGHPAFEIQVAIPPRQSGELKFRLSEPTSPGAPSVPVQPLVDEVSPVVKVPACPA